MRNLKMRIPLVVLLLGVGLHTARAQSTITLTSSSPDSVTFHGNGTGSLGLQLGSCFLNSFCIGGGSAEANSLGASSFLTVSFGNIDLSAQGSSALETSTTWGWSAMSSPQAVIGLILNGAQGIVFGGFLQTLSFTQASGATNGLVALSGMATGQGGGAVALSGTVQLSAGVSLSSLASSSLSASGSLSPMAPSPVPEPLTILLFGGGLAAVWGALRNGRLSCHSPS